VIETRKYFQVIKKLGIWLDLFILLATCFVIIPGESLASWDCFRNLHKQAISDAIKIAPPDLNKFLIPYEDKMLKEADIIQGTPKPDLKSFKSDYDVIVEIAKERDLNRYEYMVRKMTDITIYIFDAFCPIKTGFVFCDEDTILKNASVIYDGYNPSPDYSNLKPKGTKQGSVSREVDKMIPFYNKLVNEILDLWVTIWKDSKRDISGIPHKYSLVGGSNNSSNVTTTLTIEELREFGNYYLSIGDPNKAVIAFQGIIQKNKNDIDAIYNLALAQNMAKDYKGSLEHFRSIGDYKDSLYYRGQLAAFFAKQIKTEEDQMYLYKESYQSFNSYASSKKHFSPDAYQKGKSTGRIYFDLWSKLISNNLNDIYYHFEKISSQYNSNELAIEKYDYYLKETEGQIRNIENEINNKYIVLFNSFIKAYNIDSNEIDFAKQISSIESKLNYETQKIISQKRAIEKERQKQIQIEKRKDEYRDIFQ
jgi:hypothetical protein